MTTKHHERAGYRFTLLIVTAPVWFPALVAALKIFGKEWVDRWMCRWVSSHSWADEHRYGVEPVCVKCGLERGER